MWLTWVSRVGSRLSEVVIVLLFLLVSNQPTWGLHQPLLCGLWAPCSVSASLLQTPGAVDQLLCSLEPTHETTGGERCGTSGHFKYRVILSMLCIAGACASDSEGTTDPESRAAETSGRAAERGLLPLAVLLPWTLLLPHTLHRNPTAQCRVTPVPSPSATSWNYMLPISVVLVLTFLPLCKTF